MFVEINAAIGFEGDTFSFEPCPLLVSASKYQARCHCATAVNNPMARQVAVDRRAVHCIANDSGRPRIAGHCCDLAIGQYAARWYLGHNGVNLIEKIGWCFSHQLSLPDNASIPFSVLLTQEILVKNELLNLTG
jgi:hypothetical protein